MPPTPPSADDDALDLDGLDMKPSGPKAKAPAPESDFEKELEALFAEELASSDEKPASAPPVGAPEFEEDAVLLDDLVADAPIPAADAEVLDLADFSAAPEAPADAADAADDDVLDLGDFAAGGALDITPPEETPGGKDGDIDLGGLDELISGLGDKKPEPMPEPEPEMALQPHDETDMADLLESLDVPKAAAKAAAKAAEPAPEPEEMLELTLGDLVEPAPQAAAEPAPAAPDFSDLDMTLPDLSDPEPGLDLLADTGQDMGGQDMGGDLNLSMPELVEEAPALDQMLQTGDLDMTGLAEEGVAQEPERSLDPKDLLDQIPEVAMVSAPAAPAPEPAPVAGLGDEGLRVLADLQERFAALTTQVTGGSVAVVRLEGRLAEKDQAVADLESMLKAFQAESQILRSELADLRAQLEETLRAQKDATALKERLALVEDRQIQLDREVQTEIARAVPREAARVIREEIAHLAASMREE